MSVFRVLVSGFMHETNTFAPSKADWDAFNRGDSFPGYVHGQAMIEQISAVNLPAGGFMLSAQERGWTLVPSGWCGATPSSYIAVDAFERISEALLADVRKGGFDAIYLDFHGAGVAEHVADTEGELLERLRKEVGPDMPIVVSLDLHANVTRKMFTHACAMVAFRTYPHVDMADTGRRAATLLARRVALGHREPLRYFRLPFLISTNSGSTWLQPAKSHYELLGRLDEENDTISSFCMGFAASDFDECSPTLWSYGDNSDKVAIELNAQISEPRQWRLRGVYEAREAVDRAQQEALHTARPIVIADTQDNPSGGADGNTTGLLHALLRSDLGQLYQGRVVFGLLYDPEAALAATQAGVGAILDMAVGTSVRSFNGQLSDPPVRGRFRVVALSDGNVQLKGPMMTGMMMNLGPCARLQIQGIDVIVVSGKQQLLDQEQLRMVGLVPERLKVIAIKSANHFRADFTGLVEDPERHILIAKALGPKAVDPADYPWKNLPATTRSSP